MCVRVLSELCLCVCVFYQSFVCVCVFYQSCACVCFMCLCVHVLSELCLFVCLCDQGGIEAEEDYPYCSGFGKCFPCQAPGYNKTRCGPPVPATSCLKNESCGARINSTRFVSGLQIKSWVAIEKVC